MKVADDLLFPDVEPYNEFRLKVSNIHEIHIEEVGNPKGKPILFCHGGPGGGIHPYYRRYFDPKHFRVILFDQRGAGKSTPYAELAENTTIELIKDIEKIREHLNIKSWQVFGGSWGSTLALCYAIAHPKMVEKLFLRGIFLCRPSEIEWFYQEGAHQIFPDAWEPYEAEIPRGERHDFVKAYYKRLTHPDKKVQLKAAKAWSVWEASTSKLLPDAEMVKEYDADEFAIAFARIECHYFINHIFLPSPDYILENANKIAHIPCEIVHGRYDMVCPVQNAWDLHKVLPKSRLHIIPDAGHSLSEYGITARMLQVLKE